MIIENRFEVNAPVETVWAYLLDVPKLAPCLPGAELVGQTDGGAYEGRVVAKLGPVSLRFRGEARITEADEANRRIVLAAAGSEEKGKGNATMTVTSTLSPHGRGTRVDVHQDLQIAGAAAQYGRGMISDVTSVLLGSFASCIQANIDAESRGHTRTASAAAAPAGGLGIGIRAALMALTRVVRRFLGTSVRPS